MTGTSDGAADAAAGPSRARILLIIKNPSKSDGFALEVPADACLADVQVLLEKNYPGNPAVNEQTVSCSMLMEAPLRNW